ncbi:uncharacterized protein LOC142327681 [Lycorma delicatula]|uniref:uncharacterized protein LOC142327681 n=1 Tax=Lycorma delicatula TaxID=130591 RepID=UPI003F519916
MWRTQGDVHSFLDYHDVPSTSTGTTDEMYFSLRSKEIPSGMSTARLPSTPVSLTELELSLGPLRELYEALDREICKPCVAGEACFRCRGSALTLDNASACLCSEPDTCYHQHLLTSRLKYAPLVDEDRIESSKREEFSSRSSSFDDSSASDDDTLLSTSSSSSSSSSTSSSSSDLSSSSTSSSSSSSSSSTSTIPSVKSIQSIHSAQSQGSIKCDETNNNTIQQSDTR